MLPGTARGDGTEKGTHEGEWLGRVVEILEGFEH